MQQVLVTGGNGLLGFETLRQLSGSGHYVVYAYQRNIPNEPLPEVHYINGELGSANWQQNLPGKMDVIIHLAQSNHFRDFPEQAPDIFGVNSKATLDLLDYAVKAGTKKFIYTSTGGVYTGGQSPFREQDALCFENRAGFYAATKYIGEKLVENYAQLMDVIIFRPFFIYGPRQKKDMLIPRLIANIRSGQAIKLDGPDGLHINPIHVSDAAAAIQQAIMRKGSDTFNLGGNEVVSLRELCKLIGEALQKEVQFEVNAHGQARDLVGDITRLKQHLFTPTMSLSQGLLEMTTHEE